jgi:hypothetical protein
VPADETDNLSHMRVIALAKIVVPFPEDSEDMASAGVTDALPGVAVGSFPPNRVTRLSSQPIVELGCRHVHDRGELASHLVSIDLGHTRPHLTAAAILNTGFGLVLTTIG